MRIWIERQQKPSFPILLSLLSDLVFILLFPHLTLVVHFPRRTNRYGMVAGFGVAFFLRVLAGEPVLKYNAVLKYPYYEEPTTDEYVSIIMSVIVILQSPDMFYYKLSNFEIAIYAILGINMTSG